MNVLIQQGDFTRGDRKQLSNHEKNVSQAIVHVFAGEPVDVRIVYPDTVKCHYAVRHA